VRLRVAFSLCAFRLNNLLRQKLAPEPGAVDQLQTGRAQAVGWFAEGVGRVPRALDKPGKYLQPIDMATAKLFQHGGSQAVRLPKDFRFEGTEVEIEKRGDEVVLRPTSKPQLKTLTDVARFMHENFPEGRDFPDREQPLRSQIRDLDLDQDG
jgi:antitoxin VapB